MRPGDGRREVPPVREARAHLRLRCTRVVRRGTPVAPRVHLDPLLLLPRVESDFAAVLDGDRHVEDPVGEEDGSERGLAPVAVHERPRPKGFRAAFGVKEGTGCEHGTCVGSRGDGNDVRFVGTLVAIVRRGVGDALCPLPQRPLRVVRGELELQTDVVPRVAAVARPGVLAPRRRSVPPLPAHREPPRRLSERVAIRTRAADASRPEAPRAGRVRPRREREPAR